MFKNFTITFLLLISFFLSVTPIHAVDTSADSLYKIYCDRRKGNQLNLETWYGGRCPEGSNYNVEETIGFGDIILLDLYGKITNTEGENGMKDIINLFSQSKDTLEQIKILSSIKGSGVIIDGSRIVSMLYSNPPASSVEYVASVIDNFNKKSIIQPSYAQTTSGFGFTALSPILPIWRIFRDLSYLAFVLVFIYYGFMIMFRMKINPQTVMNIQLAVPKLVITLLLITFSYAIAGFLIDLSYVAYGFVFSAFMQKPSPIIGGSGIFANFASGQSLGIIGPIVVSLAHLVDLPGKIMAGVLGIPVGLGVFLSYTLGIGFTLIIAFVLGIAFIYTLFKVAWMLLKSYVTIILQIIFSPIILLGNVLPGSMAFANWVRGIFAELSIFVSVMISFILAFYFMGPLFGIGVGTPPPGGDLWLPAPLFGESGGASVLGAIINPISAVSNWFGLDVMAGRYAILGTGIFLITPSIAKSIRDALKVKEAAYGSTIGAALGFGINPFGIPGGIVSPVRQSYQRAFGDATASYLPKAISPKETPPQPTPAIPPARRRARARQQQQYNPNS